MKIFFVILTFILILFNQNCKHKTTDENLDDLLNVKQEDSYDRVDYLQFVDEIETWLNVNVYYFEKNTEKNGSSTLYRFLVNFSDKELNLDLPPLNTKEISKNPAPKDLKELSYEHGRNKIILYNLLIQFRQNKIDNIVSYLDHMIKYELEINESEIYTFGGLPASSLKTKIELLKQEFKTYSNLLETNHEYEREMEKSLYDAYAQMLIQRIQERDGERSKKVLAYSDMTINFNDWKSELIFKSTTLSRRKNLSLLDIEEFRELMYEKLLNIYKDHSDILMGNKPYYTIAIDYLNNRITILKEFVNSMESE